MRWMTTLAVAGLLFAALIGSRHENQSLSVDDPIAQSFERELNREPGPQAPVRRDSIDDDVLYQALNKMHWSETQNPAQRAGANNQGSKDDD